MYSLAHHFTYRMKVGGLFHTGHGLRRFSVIGATWEGIETHQTVEFGLIFYSHTRLLFIHTPMMRRSSVTSLAI